ncbi:hypothetical protein KUTeg_018055 [Tegillarca granosa]|uniref:Transmembrane protein n=1 Tax=Tegillarca granosa TaxID=220873 RepID=A0ABQ9EKL2_TEGGR|nr:hypothetical protein KUTeg_018055 [Tegillarca granosa]
MNIISDLQIYTNCIFHFYLSNILFFPLFIYFLLVELHINYLVCDFKLICLFKMKSQFLFFLFQLIFVSLYKNIYKIQTWFTELHIMNKIISCRSHVIIPTL